MLLAQANIALFRWSLNDKRMVAFTDQIQPVNELAKRSSGFIWRYVDSYVPRETSAPWNNELLFFNMPVLRDFASLSQFMHHETHRAVMQNREKWTKPVAIPSVAMWWIEDKHRPNVDDAIRAFASIVTHGDSVTAFSIRSAYRNLEVWLEACAKSGNTLQKPEH